MPDLKQAKRTDKDFPPLISDFSHQPPGGAEGKMDYRGLTNKVNIHSNNNITINNSNSKGLGPRGFEGHQPPPGFKSLQHQKAWPSLPKEKEPVRRAPEDAYLEAGQGREEREEPLSLKGNVANHEELMKKIPPTHMRMVSDLPDEQFAGSKLNGKVKLMIVEQEKNIQTQADVLSYLKQSWEETSNDSKVVYFKVENK